jgi:cytoskeletal protein CcmA (bactofilin family)
MAMKQPNPSVAAPSLIGADLVVQGTISSQGEIQIDGRVEGTVRARSVVVGDAAFVEGEIVADVLTIRGRASGIIQSRTTRINSGARVEGELLQEILTVEMGAHLDGTVRHMPGPPARDAETVETASPVVIGLLATATS